MDAQKELNYKFPAHRAAWIQVISGKIEVNRQLAQNGDGVLIENEKDVSIKALEDNAEFLLFDLPVL